MNTKFALAILYAIGSTMWPQAALITNNFNTLLNGKLAGQDGWMDIDSDHLNRLLVVSGTFSRCVQGDGVAQSHAAVKKRDRFFWFKFPTSSTTNYLLQFDLCTRSSGAFFSLGTNLVLVPQNTGPWFGWNGGRWVVREPKGGTMIGSTNTVGSGINANEWYRLRFIINFSAYAGEGAGSLFALNLTLNETNFLPVGDMQNINLKIKSIMGSALAPSTWNELFIRSDNSTPLDNLVLEQEEKCFAVTMRVKQSSLIELSWDTFPNLVYSVEYCNELRKDQWLPLGPLIVGNGYNLRVIDYLAKAQPQKYYRIVINE